MAHEGLGDTHIQDFFLRELAEVYLLLDNVSASSTKSLAGPKTGSTATPPDPAKVRDTDEIVAPGSDPEIAAWIKTICDVGWPPDERKGAEARQAATLILAKDYLNGLAAPATGATIAFTLLVVGEDNAEERRLKAARKRGGKSVV